MHSALKYPLKCPPWNTPRDSFSVGQPGAPGPAGQARVYRFPVWPWSNFLGRKSVKYDKSERGEDKPQPQPPAELGQVQGSAKGTPGTRCPRGPSGGRAFTRPAPRAGSGLGSDRLDSWSGDRPAGPGAAPRAPGRAGGAAYLDGCAGPRARGVGPGGRRGALGCAPVQVGSLWRKWC